MVKVAYLIGKLLHFQITNFLITILHFSLCSSYDYRSYYFAIVNIIALNPFALIFVLIMGSTGKSPLMLSQY